MRERNPYVSLRRLSERMQDLQEQTDALVSSVPDNTPKLRNSIYLPAGRGQIGFVDVADAQRAYVDGRIGVDDLERHVERLLRYEVRDPDPLDRARAAIQRLGEIRF